MKIVMLVLIDVGANNADGEDDDDEHLPSIANALTISHPLEYLKLEREQDGLPIHIRKIRRGSWRSLSQRRQLKVHARYSIRPGGP